MTITQLPKFIKLCKDICYAKVIVKKADIARLKAYNHLMKTHIAVRDNPDLYNEILSSISGKNYENYYEEILRNEAWFRTLDLYINIIESQEGKDENGKDTGNSTTGR